MGKLFFAGAVAMVAAIPQAVAQIVLPPGQTTYNVASGNTQDLNQQVTGTGGIDKTGGGTLQFSYNGVPPTNYAGATNILAGTVTANGSNTLSINSAFVISSGATLNVVGTNAIGSLAGAGNVTSITSQFTVGGDNSSTTFSGAISEKANRNTDPLLTKDGTGTLTLSGSNNLDGVTNIIAGTLRAGATNVFGGSTINVTNGATLDINGFNNNVAHLQGAGRVLLGSGALTIATTGAGDTGTFSGTISGTGGLIIGGHGSMTLSGTNSYSGVTEIQTTTSSLNAAAPNALSPNSAISFSGLGGVLALNGFDQTIGSLAGGSSIVYLGSARLTLGGNNADTVYAGNINGTGGLTKNGTGTLTLSSNNSYTGQTIINAGTIQVRETQASAFVVNGGRIIGDGNIGGLTVNGGSVAPGNSVRTLTVQGNLSLGSAATYQVNADPNGNSSKIAVTGSAALGGTLQVLTGTGGTFAPSTSYSILTAAGGISGTFSSLTTDLAFLTPSVSYGSTNAVLTLTRNDTNFTAVASTPEQATAAGAIQSVGYGNPIYDAVLGSSASSAQAAFTAVSGQIYAALLGAQVANGDSLRLDLMDRLSKPVDAGDGIRVWGDAVSNWLGVDSTSSVAGLDGSAFSLSAGADMGVAEGWRIGLTGGYDVSNQDLRDGNGRSRLSGGHAGLYWLGQLDAVALRGGALFQAGTAEVHRDVIINSLTDSTSAVQDADTRQVFAEAGIPLVLTGWDVQPFAGIAWIEASAGASAEQGGPTALNVAEGTLDQTYSSLGFTAARSAQLIGYTWLPSFRAAWQHGFASGIPTRTAVLISGSSALASVGAPLATDLALVNADIGVVFYEGARVSLGYQGALGAGTHSNGLRAALDVAL